MTVIDINSHLFSCMPDAMAHYRALTASPELERAVVSGADLKLSPSRDFPYMSDYFRTTNREVLELCERVASAKLVPWCFIDPLEPQAVGELEAWVGRGMRGVKMYPPRGWSPDDARALAVFRAAEALGVPVFLHMGRTAAHPQLRSAYARPLALEEVGLACPQLSLIIGHCAAPWQHEAMHIAMGFPRFLFDLSTSGWWDVASLRAIAAHEDLGIRRLVFGSNGTGADNLACAARVRAALGQAGFDEAQLEAIFCGNARRLLATCESGAEAFR
ncbi:MAG: amidohydrolase family protein [Planctomycetes bacterium]|nr:amidohydrolase family protein [Planctomycetota bacterium]